MLKESKRLAVERDGDAAAVVKKFEDARTARKAAYAHFLSQVLPARPPTASAKSSGGGTAWWPFAVAGAALLLVAALFIFRRRVG